MGAELDGLGPGTSPWTLLTRGFRAQRLSAAVTRRQRCPSLQQLVAIYQLLKVCGEQSRSGDTTAGAFLDRVRRIEALNEDTVYRAVSSEAADMDAVRVMTIHGSKGLEFRAVHLPALAAGTCRSIGRASAFRRRRNSLTSPCSTPATRPRKNACFFVALSRARDHLCLTRAERYTAVNAGASKFLDPLAGIVRASRYQGRWAFA